MNYYMDVLKKYAVFTGRASRAEYWYFILFNLIIGIVLSLVGRLIHDGGILGGLYSLAVFIPGLAVLFRRLHDIGKSGWWIFILLIPLVGVIWFLVLLATDSGPGDNQYGPNPKGAAASLPTV